VPRQSFQRVFLESHTVFKGTVVAIVPIEPQTYLCEVGVTLDVAAWWKGAPPETVELLTAGSEASCGIEFVVGSEYLVYASRNESGALWTHLCTRTHRTWAGDPDLEALGPPHSLPVTAQPWQQIKKLYR
jgi:hypothetical protein